MYSVDVKGLKKSYGKTVAIENLSFNVLPGEIFGILGPDGAGKTTLFRILTSLLLPNEGSVKICGLDIITDYKKIRNIVGYMPSRFSLYQDLSVIENLKLFATIFNTTIEENYHLIEDIYKPLEPFKDRRASQLSGGMKQKLALSCALIHKPDVLFLDEPTTGVDPVSRKEFWEMLNRLAKSGISIIVSTPYMDEANLCDRVALIKSGKFLTIDTPKNLVLSNNINLASAKADNMYKLLLDLRSIEGVDSVYAFGDKHHVKIKKETKTLDDISQILIDKGNKHVYLNKISPTIEDLYLYLSNLEHDE